MGMLSERGWQKNMTVEYSYRFTEKAEQDFDEIFKKME